jgi:uncharacterized protein (TIGR00297 family)
LVLSLGYAALGALVTAGLAAGAVRLEALTVRAGLVAFAFGAVIVVLAGFPYLILLALFVFASVLATRFRIEEKTRRHVQEGTRGERGVSNVVAHILVPAGLVLAWWAWPSGLPSAALAVLYASALAFGASDTFASEFGVLAGGARSILTMRPVTPGTNGGVSAAGTLWGLIGAFLTAIVALALELGAGNPVGSANVFLFVVTASGFIGCHIDSVLGELLENRGLLTKGGTNLVAMMASVLVASALLGLLGAWP